MDTDTDTWVTNRRVHDMVAQALTSDDLKDIDVDPDTIEERVCAQHDDLVTALSVELGAYEAVRIKIAANKLARVGINRRFYQVRLVGSLLLVGWLALIAESAVGINWPLHIRWNVLTQVNATFLGLVTTASTIAALIALNVTVIRIRDRRGPADVNLARAEQNAESILTERAQSEIARLVRTAVNDLEAPGSTAGVYLTTTEAPALIELDAVDTVPADGLRQVEEFINRHPTSAIGVAGPRGIGKSTVLRRVSASLAEGRQARQRVGTYVQSPVYYQAADFVRTVHEEIARAIMRDFGVSFESPERRVFRRTRLVQVAIVEILAVLGIALITFDVLGVRLVAPSAYGLLGLLLVGASLCYLALITARSRAARRAMRAGRHPIGLAERELRRLTWSANVSSKETTSLKLLSVLNSNSEQQTAYAERDRSHPERVSDLRQFLREYHSMTGVPVVVAIDELDKMASPEQAIEAINGLKDLFHLQNTHFVVSVSEDALASFALRGVPVRDVFDSSFDDVIRMRPFSAENSVNLLLGRTVKFPRVASLFCHAVSGGLPRDLIRAARRTVAVRQRATADVHVLVAFQVVVHDDLTEAAEAAALKARENGAGEVHLFKLALALAGEPNLGMDTLTHRPELLTSIEPEFVSFTLTLITIREFFTELLSEQDWRRQSKDRATIDLVEELAAARSLVAVSQMDCLRRLNHVRDVVNLSPIPVTITQHAAPALDDRRRSPWRMQPRPRGTAATRESGVGRHYPASG